MEYFNQVINKEMIDHDQLEAHSFEQCTFSHHHFDFTVINCCDFIECTFEHCTFNSIKTDGVKVRDCTFEHCHLIGITWSDFARKNLLFSPIEKMKHCYLKYNYFDDLSFIKMDFSNNDIHYCEFRDCNLNDANFTNCDLQETLFVNNELLRTDFRQSEGMILNLQQNHIKGTKFSSFSAPQLLHDSFDLYID